ncbi:WXG100 family type VII secretion target [Actinokineospora alba]|uniref:WXG100 family type VII secretion target n=1 Tax=Actinokineospora alba TaxID=504798 RepID=A0A1H0PSN0_9PSEU|nr:WXG100 family type VII secretion target [Actinokineospora alba]SDI62037.1 WXG100 family type VII secretion target [Actinokineospora alba]SDP08004.1 WXG100 family type VII secretion target [Actinokineospora alba]
MTARDAVASLGGTAAQLAAQAEPVYRAQPGAIGDIAGQFTASATGATDSAKTVTTSVDELDGAWQGASADAFVAYMAKFGQAATSLSEAMTAVAADLATAVTGLQGAKDALEGVFGELHDNATAWLNANPDKTADEKRQHVDSLAAGYQGRVTTQVDNAEQAVSTAAAAVRGRTVDPKFSAIPDPGTQTFTPAPGKPIEWTPTPPQQTSPSSADKQPAGSSGTGSGDSGGGSGSGGGGGGGGGMGSSGGPPAGPPPGNVQEWIKEAIEVLRARGINVSEKDAQLIWEIIQHESGGNPNAQNNWDCLTTDAMILTRRGWLKHEQVRAGDETIGYNQATGCSEWTRVTQVHHYEDAPLVTISNSRWSATATPNHRWLRVESRRVPDAEECGLCEWPTGVRRRGKTTKGGLRLHLAKMHGTRLPPADATPAAGFVTTDRIASHTRLMVAAPAKTEQGLDVTVTEAAILGWIAGDGHVETRKHRPSMSIAQSKPTFVVKLRQLLDGVPHADYIDDRGGNSCGPRHQFRLDPDYAVDLLRRAGNPKTDAVAQVLAMSSEQRAAWLEAITDAEANAAGYIYQSPGEILEAITLAVYLTGRKPRVGHVTRKNAPTAWAPEAYVRANLPTVSGNSLTKKPAGRGAVWCVTTDLGTWTARDGDDVFLTGNSNAAKGTPSKGLMQCIDPTFQAHKLPGHDDIWNPVDNICAGVNYAISRYGSLADVPGIKATHGGGGYVGY